MVMGAWGVVHNTCKPSRWGRGGQEGEMGLDVKQMEFHQT